MGTLARILLLLQMGALAGCAYEEEINDAHPLPQYYPGAPDIEQFDRSRPNDRLYLDKFLAEVFDTVGARRTFQFGDNEAEKPALLLGEVADLVAHSDRIFVLDGKNRNVKVLSADGRLVEHFGAPGNGPGEFFEPVALEVDDGGNVYVLDRRRSVIKFGESSGGYTYASSFDLEYNPDAFCICKGSIYVYGYHPSYEGVVHSYTLDEFKRIDVFGEAYTYTAESINTVLSRAESVVCDNNSGQLIIAYKYLPVVAGYEIDSGREWFVELPDFKTITVKEATSPSGGSEARSRIGADGSATVGRAFTWEGDIFVETTEVGGDSKDPTAYVYQLDLAKKSVHRMIDRNSLSVYISETGLYQIYTDPYPRIEGYSFR